MNVLNRNTRVLIIAGRRARRANLNPTRPTFPQCIQ